MIRTCTNVLCVSECTHSPSLSFPLLLLSPSLQKHCSIPLHIAAHEGHLDTVKRLVDGGSNMNYQDKVRGKLVDYNNIKLVEPDYNNYSFSVFSSWLCNYSYTQCTICLSQDGATPLYDASSKGHTDVVDYLIRAGASINLAKTVWRLHYTMQCIQCTLYMMQSLMS